jgi:hypothetical protein
MHRVARHVDEQVTGVARTLFGDLMEGVLKVLTALQITSLPTV